MSSMIIRPPSKALQPDARCQNDLPLMFQDTQWQPQGHGSHKAQGHSSTGSERKAAGAQGHSSHKAQGHSSTGSERKAAGPQGHSSDRVREKALTNRLPGVPSSPTIYSTVRRAIIPRLILRLCRFMASMNTMISSPTQKCSKGRRQLEEGSEEAEVAMEMVVNRKRSLMEQLGADDVETAAHTWSQVLSAVAMQHKA
eukprot:scaffold37986_cov17-Tisochrysis_lutea.AAC.1